MWTPCCTALIIVLIIVIGAVAAGVVWARREVDILSSRQGDLPGTAIVKDIGYDGVLPTSLPEGNPYGFDSAVAALTLRTCESAANRHLGGDPQLPKGLDEVAWAGDHALILRVAAAKAAAGKDLYIVAIAGTLSYGDARADLNDQLVGFYGAHAHAGFVGAWKEIYPAVRKVAETSPDAQFLITGHSLGAAVATLVAASLGVDYPGAGIALYASATPRTGSRDLINLLAHAAPNHWHITNRADIVPTLPPAVSPVLSGPSRGGSALYASFDRVVLFETQRGDLGENHSTGAYICAMVGGKTCASDDLWATPGKAVLFV